MVERVRPRGLLQGDGAFAVVRGGSRVENLEKFLEPRGDNQERMMNLPPDRGVASACRQNS